MKDWLYIECKAENPTDSEIINRRLKLIEKLCYQIYYKVKSFLAAQHRIEVQLPSDYTQLKKKNDLIENIVVAITEKKIGQWMECYSIKYRISKRKDPPEIPPNHIYSGLLITKSNTAVPLTETAVHITVPVGNVIRNALNLITDARKQLPVHLRGLIALKMFNGCAILDHIIKRIQQKEYEMIGSYHNY